MGSTPNNLKKKKLSRHLPSSSRLVSVLRDRRNCSFLPSSLSDPPPVASGPTPVGLGSSGHAEIEKKPTNPSHNILLATPFALPPRGSAKTPREFVRYPLLAQTTADAVLQEKGPCRTLRFNEPLDTSFSAGNVMHDPVSVWILFALNKPRWLSLARACYFGH